MTLLNNKWEVSGNATSSTQRRNNEKESIHTHTGSQLGKQPTNTEQGREKSPPKKETHEINVPNVSEQWAGVIIALKKKNTRF